MYLFLQIFALPCKIFFAFSHPREIGCFEEGSPALFLPNAPVLPLHPSVGEAGQDVLCQENPPRGAPLTPAQPLPGRALTAAEPSLLQSKCHGVRKCPELLLGEDTRSPRGRLEILVREKEARACCLRCFKIHAVSLAWA